MGHTSIADELYQIPVRIPYIGADAASSAGHCAVSFDGAFDDGNVIFTEHVVELTLGAFPHQAKVAAARNCI